MESLEPRLLLSGGVESGIAIEKFVAVEPAPIAGDIMCDDYAYGKPVELTMKYTGGGADATDTVQDPGKYAVTDEPGFEPFEAIVDIIATSAADLSYAEPGNTFFSGEVALDDEFVLDVDNAASLDHFTADTYIYIMDTGANLLQTVQYHTSCKEPIKLGDVVGGIEIHGFFGTNGIGAELPDEVDGYGADADDPADAVEANIGDTVVWTYVVTNIDQAPLSDITIINDNGTGGNEADDFSPAPIMDGDYNTGDTDTDGLLDAGEQWLYAARDLVMAEGPYGNVASASVSVEGGGGEDAGFTEYAVLADGDIINYAPLEVTGGFLGSNHEDLLAFSGINAPMGIRGALTFSESGGSSIGTAGSDAIVFNAGVMLSPGTIVNGDIRSGGVLPAFITGATVNGDIYIPGGESAVILGGGATVTGEIVDSPDTQPFEVLDFAPLDEFVPAFDIEHGGVTIPDLGTLPLAAGNHHFTSLTFGTGASLTLTLTDGPVTIHVDDDMTVGDNFNMTLIDGGADDVYAQVGGDFTAGNNATLLGTLYAPTGDIIFFSEFSLTGALYAGGGMTFWGNGTIQYEALDFEAVGIDVSTGGEPAVLTDSDSAHYVGVLPSIDISRFGQKAEVLMMQYTGDNVISHSQDPYKVVVTGDPDDAPTVRIVASSRADITDPKAEIYFDGEVNLSETFAIDALLAGKSKLKDQTYVTIFAPGGELLGTAKFDTSLSEPLVLGDQFGAIRLVGFIGDDGDRAGIVPVEMLTGLSGFVFEDFNADGLIDLDEYAITGATVTLTGVDDNGVAVNRVELTDSDGAYYFDGMRPGVYTITETQPVGYTDGMDSVGTAGGTPSANDTVSEIPLAAYVEGVNYNFAEYRADAGPDQVALGQTATIGFWAGKKGKKLIESLNGDKNSTALGDWLATEFPNIYGRLAGKTNKAVAKFYRHLFKATKKRGRHNNSQQYDLRDLNAQVMATAMAVYVTDSELAGNTAEGYGFLVSTEGVEGVGDAEFNVGDSGAAFGLSAGDSTIMTIWDILEATNDQAVDGDLYDLDIMLRELADKVYTMINEIGGIE